jgi:Protein of unknown function (DUF1479)
MLSLVTTLLVNLPLAILRPLYVVHANFIILGHCDSIHSVDKEHHGKGDSSVLYIPVCPMTASNVQYLVRQREAALKFSPPPDFPDAGGIGEQGFARQLDWTTVSPDGLQAMGMGSKPWEADSSMSEGECSIIEAANENCFV